MPTLMNRREESSESRRSADAAPPPVAQPPAASACRQACPVCGGRLIEIRAKLQCSQCRTIVETCCEGGPEA